MNWHPQAKTTGVKHVLFGVVAGTQEEIQGLREPIDSYGSLPKDWMPFHPEDSRPIGAFAQFVAGGQKLTSDLLGLEGDLQKELAEAETARNLVIFLVDPWALQMQQHEVLLRSYEGMHFLSSLLIPWPNDPQTRSSRETLADLVRATLAKTALREPGSYREEIDSIDRLESELIKAITNATAHIVGQAEVTRRVESRRKIAMPHLPVPGGVQDAR
jgi:FxsC-like protein